MKALIIGATGATGSQLLEILLKDQSFDQVDIFVRRPPNINHDKLNVHVIDFSKPDEWRNLVQGDVLFSCLGTTLKTAGSKENQWTIDYDYQYSFAQMAKFNQIKNYVLVSSGYASTNSIFFYSKMKGKLEEDVKNLHFDKCIIFRPPLLLRGEKARKSEQLANRVISFFNNMGLMKSNKPLLTHKLAKAMVKSIQVLENKIHTIEGQNILKL